MYASSIKPSLPYLGPLSSPSFLFSLAPALQSHSRRNLSLALSRFIDVELHSEESSVAIHHTESFKHVCKFEMYACIPLFRSFNLKFRYIATRKQTDRHTHASCIAVTLVWGSLRLTPIKTLALLKYWLNIIIS